MHVFIRRAFVAMLGVVLTAAVAVPASAELIADWQMNERNGDMIDDSGNNLDGDVGDDVRQYVRMDGGRGYAFRKTGPRVNPERLVHVEDDERLDPERNTYAVTLRIKLSQKHPNIVQKGQQTTRGGMFKFVTKRGWPRCHFRDGTGKILAIGFVKSKDPDTILSDGNWHTVRCELVRRGVKVTMDYGTNHEITRFKRGSLGNIDNHAPLTIGGKPWCEASGVTCDYLVGEINWVTIEKGERRD